MNNLVKCISGLMSNCDGLYSQLELVSSNFALKTDVTDLIDLELGPVFDELTGLALSTEIESLLSNNYYTKIVATSATFNYSTILSGLSINHQLQINNEASNSPIIKFSNNNLFLKGSVNTYGRIIEILNSPSGIIPKDGIIYKYTLNQNDKISFNTNINDNQNEIQLGSLSNAYLKDFELHLIQPSIAVSCAFQTNILWFDSGNFSTSNSSPDINTANTEYCLVFRWDGTDLLGNLAYSKTINN